MKKWTNLPALALISALLIALFIAIAPSGHAESVDKKAQFHALYNELLTRPADIDLTLRYAELASEIGDYEAAIPPLERLLMSNPEAPKLRLELGILYYLLGSYDVAKTYLQEAKTAKQAQPEIIHQADDYLQRM